MNEHNQENGITNGVIWKQLLIFFFPILLGTFFQQLYNTVDAIVVGKYVGKEALGAVGGATGSIINLLIGFFVGVASGASVIIAQFYGAKNEENTSKAVHTAIALGLCGGIFFTIIGFTISPMALRLMGTPEDILSHATTYIQVYFLGTIFNLLYNIGSGILRAVGDSKRPLYFLIICSFVNIVLDLIFVANFHLGVLGAALATLISQIISGLLVLNALMKTTDIYRLTLKKIGFHFSILKNIIQIGLPAGLQSVMYTSSNIIIQTCINTFGTNTVAAWTAYSKIDGIFWMIMSAFGISITTFAGQNYGANKFDRIKKSVRVCLGMAMVTAFGISAFLGIFGKYVYLLFTNDPAVIEIGMKILGVFVPFYFTYVCIEVLSGAIRGTGNSLIPMILTCLGVCVLRIVWIYTVVPLHHTLEMVAASYPITWAVTSILFIIYYMRGTWLKKGRY